MERDEASGPHLAPDPSGLALAPLLSDQRSSDTAAFD